MNKSIAISALFAAVSTQQIGTQKANSQQPLGLSTCTTAGGCTKASKAVTMDANWRWLHDKNGYNNCYTGASWDPKECPDADTCAKQCAVDGVPTNEWKNTYGVGGDADTLELGFLTKGSYATNVGSRTFMMNSQNKYEMFKLKNKEFTFTVDVSNMPCGINGALYFVDMLEDGGSGEFTNDKAGAQYGTGYCDAQCPQDIKFIDGKANSVGWTPSKTDPNAGTGQYGSCCAEMDIWEANNMAEAFTAHPCAIDGQLACEGLKCGEGTDRYKGVCDKDGCDLNPYRAGVKDFYGPGKTVDSTKPLQVVTQFITADGTDTGDLSEIRRIFVQDGKVIQHPKSNIPGLDTQHDSITDGMCDAFKGIMNDPNDFKIKGGLKQMGKAMDGGMVLVMSIWDDHAANMLWLDSTYPTDKTTVGGPRGDCATTSGKPSDVESQHPNAGVKFSDIKIGDLNSTYSGNTPGPTPPGPTPTPGCPGGSLNSCIGLCPSTPAAAFQACVGVCVTRCSSGEVETFL